MAAWRASRRKYLTNEGAEASLTRQYKQEVAQLLVNLSLFNAAEGFGHLSAAELQAWENAARTGQQAPVLTELRWARQTLPSLENIGNRKDCSESLQTTMKPEPRK